MKDPAELALVVAAIASGVAGCYEWIDQAATRVRDDADLQGLTPEYIRKRLHQYVKGGGKVEQVVEKRREYGHRKFYYKAIIPEPGFPQGIFVEIELTDGDPELPCVALLNAHPQVK